MKPPLLALHVFESAARHGSYTRAADELHVTHSAISQQIRALEGTLGVALFAREGRQMLLTKEGTLLFKRIQPALRQLGRALTEIEEHKRAPSITVTTLQSFANRWLLPRLGKFQKLQPDVAVHIQASQDLKDLERREADIAIRYGIGSWKGCDAVKLMDEWLFPVCSPAFNKGRLPASPKNLKRFRILRDDCDMEWNAWSSEAGIDPAEFLHGANYSDSNLMLSAAMAGQGIAIGRSVLVSEDLAAGRLMPVCDVIARGPFSYYIATASQVAKSPQLLAFEQWLLKEAAAFERREMRALKVA
ncbi:transcriptional regulator GcvA [Noviherbaspirillum sp. CPCC 100848]|uniref:Transcriptional regulator GcvA n=1 Tax=Noviherbaspirillum album TaxID=3080276 RepID=A0ABU6J620_9BURK|nr:transcriptional regulator GcvA [Noviherbaspirillum sp. CPCC 100848]MEC4718851.1 transcriptional regulator GcvA [Noviherbaspirillum sp. CPCC 100848]